MTLTVFVVSLLYVRHFPLFLIVFSIVPHLEAMEDFGRISVGGFLSKEKHRPEPFSPASNDFAIGSARFFYKAKDIFAKDYSFTSDFRDKHDFFNKLDREKKELTDQNSFQVREMSFQKEERDQSGWMGQLGRYSILESGSVFNDGASLGWRFSPSWTSFVFAGLNPKQSDKSYLEYNSKATQYGITLSALAKGLGWNQRKELSLAYVNQSYLGELDRKFLYHNGIYQWSEKSFLSSLFYLDFVPRTYIQNGQVMYQQKWSETWTSQLSEYAFDVIEYRRRQDLRETLDPSPYKETAIKLAYEPTSTLRWTLGTRQGERDWDHLRREHWIGELLMPRFFSKDLDCSFRLLQKKDFTKKGFFWGTGIGYYSDRMEYTLSVDGGREEQMDLSILNPLRSEINTAIHFSKLFFAVGGIQYETDELVSIFSLFIKLTYRFGKKDIPPIRDGAPPRGPL